MIKLDIQQFGGRGASSSARGGARAGGGSSSMENLSMQLAREIYGKQISDEVAKRYGKNLRTLPDGAVLSDYADWEINKATGEWTRQGMQNRLTYLTKGYDAMQKEAQKFEREYRKKGR